MSLERMFDAVEQLRGMSSADAAFGEPREVEGRVLIPVAQVRAGLGLGFGQRAPDEVREEGEVEGESVAPQDGGAGYGTRARPIAVIEVTPERTVVRPIVDETRIAMAGLLLMGWIVFWMAMTVRKVFGKGG